MMGETFKYCAPIAGALGVSLRKDTAEAIGLMGNAGIKSTQAGTAPPHHHEQPFREVKICGSSIRRGHHATTNTDGSMRDLSAILADCRTAFGSCPSRRRQRRQRRLWGRMPCPASLR